MDNGAAPAPAIQATDVQPTDTGLAQSAPASVDANGVKAAVAEAKRRLKIDNEEVDEEEVIKTYKQRKEHQRAANKNLQEGLKARKQAEEFITAMRDPGKLVDTLLKLGWKQEQVRQVAEQHLAGVLEDEMLDPRDKELKTTKQRLQEYEQKEKSRKEAQEKQAHDEMKKKYSEQYSREFVEALKESKLPPTKFMVAEMAKYVARASKINIPMTPLEAAKLVKEDQDMARRHLYEEADAETLVSLLGEAGLQKIRTYDTSRLKDPNANIKTPPEQGDGTRKKESSRMTPQQWRTFNR